MLRRQSKRKRQKSSSNTYENQAAAISAAAFLCKKKAQSPSLLRIRTTAVLLACVKAILWDSNLVGFALKVVK